MGVYDFLRGPCPDCGEDIGEGWGDIQVKWFVGDPEKDECFRDFRPGDTLPRRLADGVYDTYPWTACACKSNAMLYAIIHDGRFEGFTRKPQGTTHDINYERHAVQAAVREVLAKFGKT